MPNMSRRAEASPCMENRQRAAAVLSSPKLKAVLSGFWAIFHAGSSHFRANRGGAARCEQPGVRGVARAARAHNGLFAGSRSRHSMFHCKISATLRLLDIYSFLVNLG